MAGIELEFKPSTFGKKKAEPVTEERLTELRELHATMIEEAGGEPPSKTDYVVAAHDKGYKTKEIAAVLGQKTSVVYSMIWRKRTGYKPKAKRSKTVADTQAAAIGDDDEAQEITDEELEAELNDLDDLDDPGELTDDEFDEL